MARQLSVQGWHPALPVLSMAPYATLKAQKCRHKGFTESCNRHSSEKIPNSNMAFRTLFHPYLCTPSFYLWDTGTHSASASPRAHTILNLFVLNAHAFNLAQNVSLPLLSSKTVNKLENPVKTTSPNKSFMSFQDQRNWGLYLFFASKTSVIPWLQTSGYQSNYLCVCVFVPFSM